MQRLTEATGRAALDLLEWLPPDRIDMTGEPESFVELASGRRLMVLAHAALGCLFLGEDARCRVYAARPLDCRLFPFDLSGPESEGRVRLELLGLSRCDYTEDGENDGSELRALDAQRWRELSEYQELVSRWNRRARLQRRLGHARGTAADFIRYLGITAAEGGARAR